MPDGLVAQSPSAPAQPPQASGLQAKARIDLLIAREKIKAAVAALDPSSEEGAAALKALTALAKISGDITPGLMESQLKAGQGQAPGVPQMPGMGGPQMGGPAPMMPLGRTEAPGGMGF